MVEAPDIVERGRYLLTINIRLKVGKRNDRSGKTAAGHSRPSMWQRALYPHSPLGLVARLGKHMRAHDIRWPSQSPSRSVHPGDLSRDHASPLYAAAPWRERDLYPLFRHLLPPVPLRMASPRLRRNGRARNQLTVLGVIHLRVSCNMNN